MIDHLDSSSLLIICLGDQREVNAGRVSQIGKSAWDLFALWIRQQLPEVYKVPSPPSLSLLSSLSLSHH